jgi:hypothetical protein
MTYTCPICGYDELLRAPAREMICPCCGTEFDQDDLFATHDELRDRWIAAGARWWSPNSMPPAGWSPAEQLRRAGHGEIAVRLVACESAA